MKADEPMRKHSPSKAREDAFPGESFKRSYRRHRKPLKAKPIPPRLRRLLEP